MKTVAVDVCVLTVREGALAALLVRRPGNRWGVPGSRELRAQAPLAECAAEALTLAAGIEVPLEQLFTFDHPVSGQARVAYLGLTSAERHPLSPGDDVVEVRWVPLDDLPPVSDADREILEAARERVQARATYAPVAFQLVPEVFSLGELQAVYEAILDADLDTRNFRRDLRAAGVVEPVGATRQEGPGRPAQLYRHVPGAFAVVPRERRIARSLSAVRLSAEG